MRGIILVLLFSVNLSFAQTSNIISFFGGTQLNQAVYLSFTVVAGQTCSGIKIERSSDSLNFYQIGEIVGTCGSVSTPVNYSYTDSFPIKNSDNYYRLAPGNADWSTVIKVYFNAQDKSEILITPNPLVTTARINYQNPLTKTVHWKMFDINGKMVSEGRTKDDSFTIERKTFPSGSYFLHLTLDNNDFQKGKLVIE